MMDNGIVTRAHPNDNEEEVDHTSNASSSGEEAEQGDLLRVPDVQPENEHRSGIHAGRAGQAAA